MKASELLNAQTSAKKQDKQNSGKYKTEKKQMIRREEVKDTPFAIVYEDGIGWYLTMGKYKLTEAKKSKESVQRIINEKSWNLITTMIGIVTEAVIEIQKQK